LDNEYLRKNPLLGKFNENRFLKQEQFWKDIFAGVLEQNHEDCKVLFSQRGTVREQVYGTREGIVQTKKFCYDNAQTVWDTKR